MILISLDTLRSDHLPAYGYTGVETPAIDALRRDGVLFERAYSAVPLTAPSHASILSGESPAQHGLRDNVGYTYPAGRVRHLPRLLKAAGYGTAAAISAFVLRREVGFAADFDLYEDKISTRVTQGLAGIQRHGPATLDSIREWLAGAAAGPAPFFLFLHLYEPHAPYDPPQPFASRYRNLYDGEIATVDAVVGDLVAELKRLGVYERAAIVLLSDHGEGLGDHGEEGHGIFLYRSDLQVPLIVKLPGAKHAGAAVSSVVRLSDVHATILELAGVASRELDHEVSLLRLIDGQAKDRLAYAESYTPRLHFGWSELHSLIDGNRHLILGPDPELYDLASDPAETTNLIRENRRDFAELRAALEPMTAPLAPPEAVDEATRQQLAALGYIGSAAVPEGAILPDPKAMIHTLQFLHDGLEHFKQDRPAQAVQALRQAVDNNPLMVDAWNYLGRSYQRLQKPEAALAAFKRAISLSGGQPETALAAATTLVVLDRADEARLVLDHQIARSPEDMRLRYLKVQVLLAARAIPEAAATAAETLRLSPEAADSHYQAGIVAMAERRLGDAETHLRRALEIDPEHPASLSDLAVLLASTGRTPAAVELMERLVAARPGDPTARANLERMKAASGRIASGGQGG